MSSLAAHALAGAAGIRTVRGAVNRTDWERKYTFWQTANELKGDDRINERTLSVPDLCAQIDSYSIPSATNVAEWTGQQVGLQRVGQAILGAGKVSGLAAQAVGQAALAFADVVSKTKINPGELGVAIGEFVERAQNQESAEAADLRNAYGNLYSSIPETKRELFSQRDRRVRQTFGQRITADVIRTMKPINSRYGAYPGQFYISRGNYDKINPGDEVLPQKTALQRASNLLKLASPKASPNHNLEEAAAAGQAFRKAEATTAAAAAAAAASARQPVYSGQFLSLAAKSSPETKASEGGKRTRRNRKLKRSSKTRRQ